MARTRLRPLEDLLADKYADSKSYTRVNQSLQKDLRPLDAKHLAWHLTIPQFIYSRSIHRKQAILPQSDTLRCLYCHTDLIIPMDYPRFDLVTYKAFRSVYYTPSEPQECRCRNLKTLTDHNRNLRVYLDDGQESSFQLLNGPINLLLNASSPQSNPELPTDIAKVFDSPRPTTTDPFSYEVRSEIILNHINLYKTQLHTQHTLLPTESPQAYSRTYNLLIFGSTHIYFPTGHAIPYTQLPYHMLFTPLNELVDTTSTHNADWLLRRAVLTPQEATLKNKVADYMYYEILPDYIDKMFQKHIARIATRLHILRSYAPTPPIQPFLQRLSAHGGMRSTQDDKQLRPLARYRELTILRLPRFKAQYKFAKFDAQDFQPQWHDSRLKLDNAAYRTRTQHLKILKSERVKALYYMLPRRHADPSTILKHQLNTLHYLTLPTSTQTNNTLLQLTTPPAP